MAQDKGEFQCQQHPELSFPGPKAQEFGLLCSNGSLQLTAIPVGSLPVKNSFKTKQLDLYFHTFVPKIPNYIDSKPTFLSHLRHLKNHPSQVAKTISDSTNLKV